MIKRTITGAVILIFTALFVVLKQFSPLYFDAFLLVIMYGALYEVLKARKLSGTAACEIPLLLVPAALCAIFAWDKLSKNALVYVILLAVAVLLYALIADLVFLAKNRKQGGDRNSVTVTSKLFNFTKHTMMTFAYPILPLSSLFAINHLMGYDLSYVAIIMCFALAMLTDTFAFLVGSACGKHKLAPEISPNKSVEGMIGGFLGGIIASLGCFFLFYYTHIFNLTGIASLPVMITIFSVIGVVGSLLNQLGDLIESAYKRKLGIKDFSNIFPGHGGFMDRVDGLMFSGTLIYVIFALFLV